VLARSTDGGRTFTNYSWTDEPFEAGGVFFGDYSGLAAYGGRVYGIWTEKPAPPPAPDPKTNANAEQKMSSENQDTAKKQPNGTVIKMGTADFRTKTQ
jgi:hypothetical protein